MIHVLGAPKRNVLVGNGQQQQQSQVMTATTHSWSTRFYKFVFWSQDLTGQVHPVRVIGHCIPLCSLSQCFQILHLSRFLARTLAVAGHQLAARCFRGVQQKHRAATGLLCPSRQSPTQLSHLHRAYHAAPLPALQMQPTHKEVRALRIM